MAADVIFDAKGGDIVLLDVEEVFLLSDIFVIATGTSRPHVQALAERVEEKFKDGLDLKHIRVEGDLDRSPPEELGEAQSLIERDPFRLDARLGVEQEALPGVEL